MKPYFIFTMDVEQDISSKLKGSYLGVKGALPNFLDVLKRTGVKATFFVTADCCLKYPKEIKRIVKEGHELGCHGLAHEMFWFKSKRAQHKEIEKATDIIENVTGVRCRMFRTPKFGVSGKTIQALEHLEYEIDSSVMPDAEVRIFRKMYKVHSLQGALQRPYFPSFSDVKKEGLSNVLEIPLTKSPAPNMNIGMGSLNKLGPDKMLEMIEETEKAIAHKKDEDERDNGNGGEGIPYIMFLAHPWEMVDLGAHHPNLKPWVLELCKDDPESLEAFIRKIKQRYNIVTVGEIGKKIKDNHNRASS